MKTLVDEIMDIVGEARTRGMYPVVTDAAKDLLGRICWFEDDDAELFKMFTIIADRIEREYLPRPRFEDGEPVQFGDEIDACESPLKVDSVTFCSNGRVFLGDLLDFDELEATGERVKRPKQEVLDADGVPIKVGDHVWWKDGREFVITAVNRGVNTEAVEPAHGMCSSHVSFDPKEFTHKQPDSLERIEEDAKKVYEWYWGCNCMFSCEDCPAKVDGKKPHERYATRGDCMRAQYLDLLIRQRKLLERGQ